jgi:HAMP domain-containing protein
MSPGGFSQNTSILTRLRNITVTVAVFFLFSFVGLYISSQRFLTGLREMYLRNQLSTYANQITEALTSSEQIVDRLQFATNVADLRFSFHASQRQLRVILNKALRRSRDSSEVNAFFRDTEAALFNYENAIDEIFDLARSARAKGEPISVRRLGQEVLVGKQFENDVKESLRKAQITLKLMSDDAFEAVYDRRHEPLIVGTILALLFFSIAMVFGLSLTRGLSQSIRGLLTATDEVSQGNLDFVADIHDRDEIGKLTFHFNEMVRNLKEGREELKNAVFARDEFLSIASHELRTPISILSLQLEMLERKIHSSKGSPPTIEEVLKALKLSNSQTRRLVELVEDLLDVSQIKTGRLNYRREEVELGKLTHDVVQSLNEQRGKNLVQVHTRELVFGFWDRSRIEQVILNLVSNAF